MNKKNELKTAYSSNRKKIFESFFMEKDLSFDDTTIQTLELAIEIAREGREGRKIGTIFVIGNEKKVLKESRSLILDPLFNHPLKDKHITNSNLRETIKELAQLDGGFVVTKDGYVISGARFFNSSIKGLDVLHGLGSRHLAAASITKKSTATAIVVSESSVVRIFKKGKLIAEILPELWLISRYSSHIQTPVLTEHNNENMAIVASTKKNNI